MKAHTAVLSLSLALILAGAPAAGLANPGWRGGAPPRVGRHPVMGPGPGQAPPPPAHVPPQQQFPQFRQFPHQFPNAFPFQKRVFPRFPFSSPFFFGSSFWAPPIYYGSSFGYDYGNDPPVAYAPPAPAYVPYPVPVTTFMPAPPRPSVIEFPSGRYELRGDGISSPLVWVWVPNPPPPPPGPPPDWTPRPGSSAPPASDPPAPRRTQLYRWVDEQGVIHLTDNPETVPAQFRKPATRAQGGAS